MFTLKNICSRANSANELSITKILLVWMTDKCFQQYLLKSFISEF